MKYYKGNDGKIYKDYELVHALYLFTGIKATTDDLVIEKFKGIAKPIEPTIYDFIWAGQRVDAIRLYYDMENEKSRAKCEPPITLEEAKDYIYELEKKMMAD